MVALLRPFLPLLLAVALLGATTFEAAANLTAEISAAVEPCCESDCGIDPVCDLSCTMMTRCGGAMSAILQTTAQKILTGIGTALLPPHEQPPAMGLVPHALKRPPRI